MTLKAVCRNTEEAEMCETLSKAVFPPEEFSTLEPLLEDERGHGEVFAIDQNGEFAGFLACLTVGGLYHIIYFAVKENLRGQGMGRKALECLAGQRPGKRILVDIEQPVRGAENLPERLRRKAFYLKNGFAETETKYRWRGVDYEILSRGGNVTKAEFWKFWKTLENADEKYGIY